MNHSLAIVTAGTFLRANLTAREKVSALKNVSNLMTFRSPNYNPAGVRRATSFDDQITIVYKKSMNHSLAIVTAGTFLRAVSSSFVNGI